MEPGEWCAPRWSPGTDEDPDAGWEANEVGIDPDSNGSFPWHSMPSASKLDDAAILVPLESQFGQVRSKERVRALAEVFTHQREVGAILDLVPDAFTALDVKFLEPSSGSGNFLTEILRRKLRLVAKSDCVSQEQYEHRLLRAVASTYGVDISPENVTEARGRLAHVLLEHFQCDANRVQPTTGFLNAAALMLGSNVVVGDTLNSPQNIEFCDWQPRARGCFQRVWSFALVPPAERDLFWMERVEDPRPVHYCELVPRAGTTSSSRPQAKAGR